MTIDEVIENLKCDIEIDMYIHEIAPQIAEWLDELVDYRRFNGAKTFDNGFKQGEKYGYNKAIDEFVNLVNECSGYTPNCIEHYLSLTVYTIHQIAEELKG